MFWVRSWISAFWVGEDGHSRHSRPLPLTSSAGDLQVVHWGEAFQFFGGFCSVQGQGVVGSSTAYRLWA